MKPLTREWMEKAEADYATMVRESRVRKNPNYDGICFHAQQSAEKYLKARLCEAGIDFPKTHSLTALLDKVLAVEPLWEAYREHLSSLAVYAVASRYPGESATREEALSARQRCRHFRAAAREALGLEI